MFTRSEMLGSLLRSASPARIDSTFAAFVSAVVEQVDLPSRMAPLLAEELGDLHYGDPRDGGEQIRDLLVGVARRVMRPRFPEVHWTRAIEALALGDVASAASLMRAQVPEDDGGEASPSPGMGTQAWREMSLRCFVQALDASAESKRLMDFYTSDDEYGVAAAAIAGLGVSTTDALMNVQKRMVDALGGGALSGRSAGPLALCVVCLTESEPDAAVSIVRDALRIACAAARFTESDVSGGALHVFDMRNRISLALAGACTDETDPIFTTLLFELAEQVDVDTRRIPIVMNALAATKFGEARPTEDAFRDAAQLTRMLLRKGIQDDRRLDEAITGRRYEEASALLRASHPEGPSSWDLKAAWPRESESWAPVEWRTLARRAFAEALSHAARISERADNEGYHPNWLVSPVARLASAIACEIRAEVDLAGGFRSAVESVMSLARLAAPREERSRLR